MVESTIHMVEVLFLVRVTMTSASGTRISSAAVVCDGAVISADLGASLTVTNTLFTGNRATESGGVVHLVRSSGKLINCTMAGNYATYGGAVSLIIQSSMDIESSVLDNNHVSINGGGINLSASSSVMIRKSEIKGNLASIKADGINCVGQLGQYSNISLDEFSFNVADEIKLSYCHLNVDSPLKV